MRTSLPLRIAHRGASGRRLAPENTLPAFEEALKIGTDAIEMDVRLTGDGRVVVLHDDTLDRTTDRTGTVSRLTLDEIKAADAGVRFDARFQGTRVPTLEEALDLLGEEALALVEIKAEGITQTVVQTVARAGARDRVLLVSFNSQTVREASELDPGLPTGLIVGSGPDGDPRAWVLGLCHRLSELHANLLALQHDVAAQVPLRELGLRGLAVWLWTVDEIADLDRAADLGPDGIVSNYPDRLAQVLAART